MLVQFLLASFPLLHERFSVILDTDFILLLGLGVTHYFIKQTLLISELGGLVGPCLLGFMVSRGPDHVGQLGVIVVIYLSDFD